MTRNTTVMDGGLASEGECIRCEREGVVLLDGHLCEQCHGEVWAAYEGTVQRFGLYAPTEDDDGEQRGLVAAGVGVGDRAILAWLHGPPSAEVYEDVEGFVKVYENRENLYIIWL